MPLKPGVLLRDPLTRKLLRDKATRKLLRVPSDSDVSCLCICAPGCNDGVSCVSLTFSSDFRVAVTNDCVTFIFATSGEYKLLPQNADGTPSRSVWSGCFTGPAVTCGTADLARGCGCCGPQVGAAAQVYMLALCPLLGLGTPGAYVVDILVGDLQSGGDACCTGVVLNNVSLHPGVPFDLSTITPSPDTTVVGTVTLNQILPTDPPPRTCTGTDPIDCALCGTQPACESCIDESQAPGSTCPASLPATIQADLTGFSLCAIDGCADSCALGPVTCVYDSGSCAGNDLQYVGTIDIGGGGPCVKVVFRWDGTNWIAEWFDIRCSQSTLMWRGYWIAGGPGEGGGVAPGGAYRQSCGDWCGEDHNAVICDFFVTTTGSCDCGTATGLPTTRTVVITGSPNACLNGTWTLDNGPNVDGPFCVYGTGTPCGAFGSALTLRWGDGSIGNPGPWNILSFSTNPAVDMTGGTSCDPVGATATATDGTVITVTA